MSALVVNMLAGPGAGKSTMAAAVFTELKYNHVDCEYAQEFAKDLTWEERHATLDDQIYVFGKQHHRLFRLENKVDVIINDSPLIFSVIYSKLNLPAFDAFVFEAFNRFKNMNYYIERNPETYNPNGRNQDLESAIEIDNKILRTLYFREIKYQKVFASKDSVGIIVSNIMKEITSESPQ